MSIEVACPCGLKTRVSDAHAGKRAKCPSCQSIIVVPKPPLDAEEAAAEALLQDDESPPTEKERPSRAAPEEAPRPSYLEPVEPYSLSEPKREQKSETPHPARPQPKKVNIKYKGRKKSEDQPQRAGIQTGAVFSGIGLMALGGVVCMVRPIYGGCLIVAGLFSLVTGLMGIVVENDE